MIQAGQFVEIVARRPDFIRQRLVQNLANSRRLKCR